MSIMYKTLMKYPSRISGNRDADIERLDVIISQGCPIAF